MRFFFLVLFIVSQGYSTSAADFNIVDFGAVNNKYSLSTKAIQNAIEAARKSNQGRVIIPKGNFLTGSITLYSNVCLHLEKGATLYGSTDINDYYALSKTTATYNWKALILSYNESKISITGSGIINGQGKQLALNIDDMFYTGQLDSSKYQLIERRPKAHIRPQIIQFVNCTDITISNITIKNAASWVQVYDLCKRLVIHDIKVESVSYWNNDGIDLIDCTNVEIKGSKFNASDDGICLKSYRRNTTPQPKCDSIYIHDCSVRSSASAVKLGTSSFGGFTNIKIEDIRVFDTYRSAIAIESWETGIIDNISIKNIIATNTGNALFIRLNKRDIYNNLPNGVIKNVTVDNLKCTVPFIQGDMNYNLRGPALPFFHNVFPMSITGYPNVYVTDIKISNIKVIYPGKGESNYANMPIDRLDQVPEKVGDYPEFSMFGELPAWGLYARHVNGLEIENVKLKIRNTDYRSALVFDDVKRLQLNDVKVLGDTKKKKIVEVRTTRVP